MGKLTSATAPDFTDDEQKYLEKHPGLRTTLFLVRLALVPIALALITGYYDYRVKVAAEKAQQTEDKAKVGYQVTREAMESLQAQVKLLTQQLELMQQLVLAPKPAIPPSTRPPASPLPARPPVHHPEQDSEGFRYKAQKLPSDLDAAFEAAAKR